MCYRCTPEQRARWCIDLITSILVLVAALIAGGKITVGVGIEAWQAAFPSWGMIQTTDPLALAIVYVAVGYGIGRIVCHVVH